MLKKIISLTVLATALNLLAGTTLTLTWMQPPDYQSQLYSSTNIAGAWTPLGVVSPPVDVETTNQVVFFYVAVAPAGSQQSQILNYSDNPNSSCVKPPNTNAPAIAYDPNGFGGTYGWNIQNQDWE